MPRRPLLIAILGALGCEARQTELCAEVEASLSTCPPVDALRDDLYEVGTCDDYGILSLEEEGVRRDLIKNMRSTIAAPEHRFFLALLMNAPTREHLLALVKRRYPKPAPVETVMRWAQELAVLTEDGVELLDAVFPATLDADLDDQPAIFLSALHHFLSGSSKLPPALRGQPPAVIEELHQAFAASTLGMLVV